jgi:hypothetical protein
MTNRAASNAEQQAWRRGEHDSFRHVGELLRDVIPPVDWPELDADERRRRVESAADLLRRELGVKRPAPLVWIHDPTNEGLAYDEESDDGDVHFPDHHLEQADPEHLVRGLTEEMRHAWQDDVRRGLTDHPLGDVGRHALKSGFRAYRENDPRNDTSNILELDAKERAEWCVDGYLGNPPNFD